MRRFTRVAAALVPLLLFAPNGFAQAAPKAHKRVVFLAVDSLDPRYLTMNADASGPGAPGDWLMPNVRSFVESTSWWPFATGTAPHSTDVNHIGALSATSGGQSGIIGVFRQPAAWDSEGLREDVIKIDKTRYADGKPRIATLFDLLEDATQGAAKTAMLANKGWMTDFFRVDQAPSVDVLVDGYIYPEYVAAPESIPEHWWDDPETDDDADCDPEHPSQTFFLQNGLAQPNYHPRDKWIAEATLAVVDHENPDMLYVLLGDLDHGQHFLGSLSDPAEWVHSGNPELRESCSIKPEYQLVSNRNPELYKEPILDLVRQVDTTFGWLVSQLETRGYLEDAVVVLLSDHSMINMLYQPGLESETEILTILQTAGVTPERSFHLYGAGGLAYLYWRPLYKFFDPGVVSRARAALLSSSNLVLNPQTGKVELPWSVLTRKDMAQGALSEGILPRHLYHPHIVKVANNPAKPEYQNEAWKAWPDLIVMTRNGWQLTKQPGSRGAFNASHGGPDTAGVVLAATGLQFPAGALCLERAKLPDIGVTVAAELGLQFPHDATGIAKPLACTPY